jgi:hypothetical protein
MGFHEGFRTRCNSTCQIQALNLPSVTMSNVTHNLRLALLHPTIRMSLKRSLLLALVLLPGLTTPSFSQNAQLIRAEDGIYTSIRRLQNRGYLLELNPTDLPYSEGRLREAMNRIDSTSLSAAAKEWVRLIDDFLGPEMPRGGTDRRSMVGLRVQPGLMASNNGRIEPLRYLPGRDERVWENALFQGRFSFGPIAAAMGFRHDLYYDRDPDGLDSALRWLVRSEDGYLRYDGKYVQAEFGRFSRHWGVFSQEATLISSNPRSYDQLGLRIGGNRLSLRTILGELDSITGDGRFTGAAGDDSVRVGSERRFIAAHRLDWRPDRNTVITVTQATLYSGANSSLSLKFANPLHPVIFALNNVPKNDENNGFLGLSVWLRRSSSILALQGVLDDFDLLNLKEPASFALSGSLTLVSAVGESDFTFGGSAVASRTFNTLQPEGRLIYLQRGLATQFSDYVTIFSSLDWYAFRWVKGLTLTPRIDVLWQGEEDIRNEFPRNKDFRVAQGLPPVGTILTGVVERTTRTAVQITYEPDARFFLRMDTGINFIRNAQNVTGRSRTRFLTSLSFGFRFALDRSFDLDF